MGAIKSRWVIALLAAFASIATALSLSAARAQTVPPPKFSWSVTVPAPTGRVWNGEPIQVNIRTGPETGASGLQLAQPYLQQRDTGELLMFELCETPDGACRLSEPLSADSLTRLYLRPAGGARVGPGGYEGHIAISAAEDVDGKTVQMELHVSGPQYRLLGIAAIAIGVMMAWLLSVAIRNMLGRKELQRVLAQLRRRRDLLVARLEEAFGAKAREAAPRTFAMIARLDNDLAEAVGWLPPAIPTPWQGQWADRARFEELVTSMDGRLDGLEVIVAEGLEPASRIATPAGRQAVKKIDALADGAGVRPLAELTVAILDLLNVARPVGPRAADGEVAPSTPEKYSYEIVLLGAVSWGIILAATVLVGLVALVLPDKDFGQWKDYVVCLLWGLGLPIAGGQLTSLGADSVRTALTVTRPTSP